MENDNTLRIVIGAMLGVGCGGFLLVACVASGVWLAATGAPVATGPGPSAPPPYVPPPYVPPPVSPPPYLPPSPPTLPPPLPPPPGLAGDTAPRLVRATVTEVSGAAGVSVGALCEFNVERRENEAGGFWCNAQVVCGGRLLYGGAEAGYFPCVLHEGPPRDVVGEDTGTTSVDRDGAMRLDTRAGTLEVWDDATGASGEYRVAAHVDSVE